MIRYIGVVEAHRVLAEFEVGRDGALASVMQAMAPQLAALPARCSVDCSGRPGDVLHVLKLECPATVAKAAGTREPASAAASGQRTVVSVVCVASREYGRILPMKALEHAALQFRALQARGFVTAAPAPFSELPTEASFEAELAATLERFTDPAGEALARARANIAGARTSLADTLEAAVERGSSLRRLEEESLELRRGTASFSTAARRAANRRWCGSVGLWWLLALALVLIAVAVWLGS